MSLKFTLNLVLLGFFFVTQSVNASTRPWAYEHFASPTIDAAARGVNHIWGIHEKRRGLYVESLPANQVNVERKTKEINEFLRTARVAHRTATLKERTTILESVIAGEYVSTGPSEICYRSVDKNDRLYGHYTVLRLTQELARSTCSNASYLTNNFLTISKVDDSKFATLGRLSGMTKDAFKRVFKSMFDNVKRTHVKKEEEQIELKKNEFVARVSEFTQDIKTANTAVCNAATTYFANESDIHNELLNIGKNSEKIKYVLSFEFIKKILTPTEMNRFNQILGSEFLDPKKYGKLSISARAKRILNSLNESREYNNEVARILPSLPTSSLNAFNDQVHRIDIKLPILKEMLPTEDLINECMGYFYKAYQKVLTERLAAQGRTFTPQIPYSSKDIELFSATETISPELGGGIELHRFGGFIELSERVFENENIKDRLEAIVEKYPFAQLLPQLMKRMQDEIKNDPVIKQLHIIHTNECLRFLGFLPSDNIIEKTLKQRYRKLCLAYHPDKNKTEEAQAIFKIISDAYQHLMKEYE